MISFLSVFPPYRGGIAKFSDYLIRNLKDKREVKAYNFTNLYPSLLFPGKNQFLESTNNTKECAKRILHSWNPLNWKQAANEIASENPDHLLISYWHPFFAPAFLKVIRQLKKLSPQTSISLLAHNILPHENFPLGKTLSKKLMDMADHVIVLSEKSQSEAENLSLGNKVLKLFHPVYDQNQPDNPISELRKQYGVSNNEFVLLFFGLVRPYKGLDIMIEALNGLNLKANQIHPLIVGEFYTDKESLLSQINEEHRKEYTVIDRFVSDQEMAEILTLSDAMVMPYRSATQSGILANAINFGLPCIVSDLKGLTEHLEAEKTALIFPSEDVNKLRKAIESMQNDEIRTTIRRNLRVLKEELSWVAFTDLLIEKVFK